MKIIVELPDARQHYGRLRLVDDSGNDLIEPVPAIGRADPHNWPDNRHSDPLLEGGNTPTGGYTVVGLRPPTNAADAYRHGPHGKLELKPVSGQALQAASVRTHLQIHGGYLRNGALRPTSGCIRISDSSMKTLLDAMEAHEEAVGYCEVVSAAVVSTGKAAARCEEPPDDPPSSAGALLPVPHHVAPPPPPSPPQPTPPSPGPGPGPEPDPFPGHQGPSAPGPAPGPEPVPAPAPAPTAPGQDDEEDDEDDSDSDDGDGGDGGGEDSALVAKQSVHPYQAVGEATEPGILDHALGLADNSDRIGIPRLSGCLMLGREAVTEIVSKGIFVRRRNHPDNAAAQKSWRFDLRRPLGSSRVLRPVASAIVQILTDAGIHQIAGRGFGAFPLLGAVASFAPDLCVGFIRETPKGHGFGRWIEGDLRVDVPVVLIDDFVNRGRSSARTWSILRQEGFNPAFLICVATIGNAHRQRQLGGRINPMISLLEFDP